MSIQLLFCTCPDSSAAERLAEALVARRLAACVNILPGLTSVYRWQGVVERSSEHLLLIKSTSDRYDALEAAIRELHPYELPEVIAVEAAAGLPAYLAWIAESTA
jgi:periplasmic divalent cation tolerance protein